MNTKFYSRLLFKDQCYGKTILSPHRIQSRDELGNFSNRADDELLAYLIVDLRLKQRWGWGWSNVLWYMPHSMCFMFWQRRNNATKNNKRREERGKLLCRQ